MKTYVRHFGSSHSLDFRPGVARDMEQPEPWEVFEAWERPPADGSDDERGLEHLTREGCEDELLAYTMYLKNNSQPGLHNRWSAQEHGLEQSVELNKA